MKEGEYGQGKQEERSGRVIASRPDSLVTVVIVGSFITATSIVVDYNIKLFNTNVSSVTVTVNYITMNPLIKDYAVLASTPHHHIHKA